MKKGLFSSLFILSLVWNSFSQCTTCTPSHTGCPASGGICGHSVVGMVNHPYTTSITFLMPKKLNSPSILSQCSCSEVDLNNIRITGVGGLPTGISALFDKPQSPYLGYYNVSGGDSLGCANFCGTPLAAGIYPITMYIEAHVTAIGTPIGNVDPGPQNQTYTDTMVILPDTSGAVSSFTYTPHVKADCDSLRLSVGAILSAPSPNPTSYFWDFGNGNHSTAQTPAGTQFYSTQGVYPLSLQTVYYKYRLKKVFINNFTGGYYPDYGLIGLAIGSHEETTNLQNPDPYFKIGAFGYTSNFVTSTKYNISFDNVNLVFPLGTDTFALEIWDKDNGPPLGSADDLAGTFIIHIIPGQTQFNWSNGNASGYVEFDTVFGTSIVDTLKVNIEGRPAKPWVQTDKDTLCYGDSARLVITPPYTNAKYEWWQDSTFLILATDSVLYAKNPANYHVRVTNLNTGCTQVSDTPYRRIEVSGPLPSSANIVYDGSSHQFFLNPFPGGMTAIWYFNGLVVTGQSGRFLPSMGAGIYTATVYPTGYPRCSLNSAPDTLTSVGIADMPDDISSIAVYPNPNNGSFNLKINVLNQGTVAVKLYDMLGREVYEKSLTNEYGEVTDRIDISQLSKEVYTLQVSTPRGKVSRRVVVE